MASELLFDCAPFPLVVLGEEGDIRRVNDAAVALLRRSGQQLIGENITFFVSSDFRPALTATLHDVMLTKRTVPVLLRLENDGGLWAVATLGALPATHSEGQICALIVPHPPARDDDDSLDTDNFPGSFRQLPEAAFLLEDDRILRANQVAADLLGHPNPASLIGTRVTDYILPRWWLLERAWRRVVMSGRTPGPTEFQVVSTTGEVRHVYASGRALQGAVGPNVLVLLHDVTVHKNQEFARSWTSGSLLQLIDHAPLGVMTCDQSGQILDVNHRLLEILGSPSKEATRLINLLTFPSLVQAGVSEDFRTCLERGIPLVSDRPYVSKWGKTVHLRYHLTPIIGPRGERLGLHAMIEDFTDRIQSENALRESEEKFRIIAEHSLLGIAIVIRGRLCYANRTFRALMEIFAPEPAELPLEDYLEKVVVEDRALLDPWLLRDDDPRAGASIQCSYRIKNSQGRIIWLEQWSRHIPYEGETAELLLLLDVSERVQAEQARVTLEQRMQQTARIEAIGRLAGGIAHDFNNHLQAISGYTELALDRAQDIPELLELLTDVLEAANQSRGLVDEILRFSRSSEAWRIPLDLDRVVKSALRLLRPMTPANVVVRHHSSSRRANVLADPTQMHQVVVNLLSNALTAMGERGGMLEVAVEPLTLLDPEKQEPQVQLTVSDTGEGICGEHLEQIFEPFFTTHSREGHNGMGLAVVHGIIRAHGGDINVKSVPGMGSTFSIRLPLVDAEEEENHRQDGGPPVGGSERILLVDDEQVLVRLFKLTLQQQGYAVTGVHSGTAALALFQSAPDAFDLLITDQTMPRFTGFELATAILARRPDFPVILCSGHSESVTEPIALKAGIRRFLMKPIRITDLAEEVRAVLDEVKEERKGGPPSPTHLAH